MLAFPTDPFDADAPGRSMRTKLLDLAVSVAVVLAGALVAGGVGSLHAKGNENDSATGCRAPASGSESP